LATPPYSQRRAGRGFITTSVGTKGTGGRRCGTGRDRGRGPWRSLQGGTTEPRSTLAGIFSTRKGAQKRLGERGPDDNLDGAGLWGR